jgi:hypothetical protein
VATLACKPEKPSGIEAEPSCRDVTTAWLWPKMALTGFKRLKPIAFYLIAQPLDRAPRLSDTWYMTQCSFTAPEGEITLISDKTQTSLGRLRAD